METKLKIVRIDTTVELINNHYNLFVMDRKMNSICFPRKINKDAFFYHKYWFYVNENQLDMDRIYKKLTSEFQDDLVRMVKELSNGL